MAFNPFRAFRKRQKTFLAVMAIVCMLLFVAGDVISGRKGNILGSGKSRDNVVVTKLYGTKISETEVRLAREQHRLGSQFMVMAAADGLVRLSDQTNELRKGFQKGSEDIQRFIALQKQSDGLKKTFVRFFAQTDNPMILGQISQQLDPYLNSMFGNLRMEFFEGFRNQMQLISLDDTLDYMIWKHQADQLGINLTESSIEEAVKNLTFDAVDLREVEKTFLVRTKDRETPLSHDLLYESVGNLLRVKLAKEALIGLPPETSSAFDQTTSKGELKETNSLITPDEFWDFYKKQKTSREIGILSFPVKNFLAQVKDKPSIDDLEQFFHRFENDEYSPVSNRPGFKEPRRLRLQWVGARADSAEYKKFADDYVLASVASTPLNPWPAVALAYEFENDYQKSVRDNRIPRYDRLPYQLPDLQIPSTIYYEPMPLTSPNEAANLAGTLASTALGRPWSSLGTYAGAPIAREVQKRAAIGSNLFLLGPNPWNLAVAELLAQQKPKFVPLSEVGEEATKKLKKTITQDMVINNLNNLKKELPNLKKEMDEKRAKKESDEEIAKWFAKKLETQFHVTQNVLMKEPLGQFEMSDDPELKPLKEIYMRLNSKKLEDLREDEKGWNFAKTFFGEVPTYVPMDWPPSDNAGGFNTTWATEDEPIVYWKTEDKKAYVPTFAAARAKVEKAWDFKEARKLARQEADRVAELARATKGDVEKLRDLAAKKDAKFIELRSVALIHKAGASARPDANSSYEPFKFPDSISMPKDNRYGPEEFLAKLAGLMTPGDTVVEGNQPDSILYVSTLISKQEPTLGSFYDVYRNAKSEAGRDILLERWMQGKKQMFRYELMNQLRTEASPDVVDGRFNIDPEILKHFQTTNREDTGE